MNETRRSRGMSPALILAIVALVVALAGTSYAAFRLPARSVGTAQLRAGAVTAPKVRAHSLLASNFKLGQLPVGPQGPVGPRGPAGAQGPRGESASDQIPAGRTVTGNLVYDGNSPPGVTSDYTLFVRLPALAAAPLTSDIVNFAPAPDVADGDSACRGTLGRPTAPPGRVCLYIGQHSDDLQQIEGRDTPMAGLRDGFDVAWYDSGANLDNYVFGTWAYTTPR